MRSCAYWEAFEQTKLVVPAISGTTKWLSLDREGGFFAISEGEHFCMHNDAAYVAAIVNSPVAFWFTRQVFATKQGGFF